MQCYRYSSFFSGSVVLTVSASLGASSLTLTSSATSFLTSVFSSSFLSSTLNLSSNSAASEASLFSSLSFCDSATSWNVSINFLQSNKKSMLDNNANHKSRIKKYIIENFTDE
ncbi:hypothetical protein Hanom_Chr11g01018191 [Helianthus anomalus]